MTDVHMDFGFMAHFKVRLIRIGMMVLTTLSDDDRFTLERYEHFRAAAEAVAVAFAGVPAVKRVALFGSVASTPRIESDHRRRGRFHEPKDVDLAVWLDGEVDLNQLRVLSARAVNQLWEQNEIGVAHHQVDVFLLDAKGKYLGRLCHFKATGSPSTAGSRC